jgi:hypothetical protein
MTDTPMHLIVDCVTGETSMVPFTADEIAAQQVAAQAAQAEASAKAKAEAAQAAALATTNAKLIALGLTQGDINNLLNAAKA